MLPNKPDLVVLPFKATLQGSDTSLTLDQTLSLLRSGVHVQIERSHPGATDAIGWTIFRRTPGKYLYENAPSSASNAARGRISAKPTPSTTRSLAMIA